MSSPTSSQSTVQSTTPVTPPPKATNNQAPGAPKKPGNAGQRTHQASKMCRASCNSWWSASSTCKSCPFFSEIISLKKKCSNATPVA